ncbi:MAG TPA: diacylglycerol kinase family protein [Pyrinomonadaceae bacterium]
MSEGASLLVVVNHAAARARRAWPGVRAALDAAGVPFDAHETRAPGDAHARTREALRAGYRTIAAVGGDGTLSEVASGFFEDCEALPRGALPAKTSAPRAALALLPAGTGDDFARGLSGGRRVPLESWTARLVAHCRTARAGEAGMTRRSDADITRGSDADTTRSVDVLLGETDAGARRFVCLNAATLGIGAEVAARVGAQGERLRRLPGEARFALAALAALVAWRDRSVRLRVDDGEWRECRTNIMAVTNGTHAGGGMNLSPDARVDDGRLDVLTACNLTPTQILRELARVHTGGHVNNPQVSCERGVRVQIETIDGGAGLGVEADGDVRGRTPAEFRVMPAALRVVW